MNLDHRKAPLGIQPRLDLPETEANAIPAESADADNVPFAKEVRELIVEMQAREEDKLERIG